MKFMKAIPLLVYRDIAAAHRFLIDAFGFEDGGLDRGKEGHVIHGELTIGDTTIWLHREVDEFQLASPQTLSHKHGGLVIQVDDVASHYKRAVAAGATVEGQPEQMPYGQREYQARDPEGHEWWFAERSSSED